MPVNPLSHSESTFWDLRRKGLGFAQIGRKTGITRQAVYKALLKADKAMTKALREIADTYKIDLEKANTQKGMATGYSHALQNRVILAYSPKRGMLVWYEYTGQCKGCPRRQECRSIILEEAERLGSILTKNDREPAELAQDILREAWPEGFTR